MNDRIPTNQKPERFSGTIRALKFEDIEQVESVLRAWIHPDEDGGNPEFEYIVKIMRASVEGASDTTYRVAEESGEVIGIMGLVATVEDALIQFIKTSKPAQLVNVYVNPADAKGRGVGSRLLEDIEKIAQSMGYTELILWSGPARKDTSWGFYDKKFGPKVGDAKRPAGHFAPVWRKDL